MLILPTLCVHAIQLLSYGGILSYIITFYAQDGSGLSNQEPQVLMSGGTLRNHVIYTDMDAPDNGVMTQHNIRLTEVQYQGTLGNRCFRPYFRQLTMNGVCVFYSTSGTILIQCHRRR